MSRRTSGKSARPAASAWPDNPGWDRRTVIGVAWLLGFLVYFSSSILPNNSQFSRLDLWLYLPDYFLTYWQTESVPGAPESGWRYFPQRFDLIAVATFVLASSYAAGSLALRAMKWPDSCPRSDRFVIAAGAGLSFVSLLTLTLGLAGRLSRPLFIGVFATAVVVEGFLAWRGRRALPPAESSTTDATNDRRSIAWLVTLSAPFVLAMMLGSMLPDSDFDVREYHLQGPKEYFQTGRISFLPHNVYTSFPFLTEMLSLSAMVVRGDWYRGALAGKLILMAFAPLTAVAVFAVARRIGGTAAGSLAALFHLSTPWIYRISIIAYAEGGLTFFLAAATLATILTAEQLRAGHPQCRILAVMTGFLAGGAMACKYPGALSVVLPAGAALTMFAMAPSSDANSGRDWKRAAWVAGCYGVGVIVAVGPWLLKNLLETGNPVYPLVWSLFGGRDWDAAMNLKWKAAHSPADYDLSRLWFWLTDVTARNDWLSPLLYGFAPLAAFAAAGRKIVGLLWAYLGYLFVTWWLFTHRLDRFWVPMLPIAAMLAGIGAAAIETRGWRIIRNTAIGFCLAFNLCLATSPLSGPNGYLVDLDATRPQVAGPAITTINETLLDGSKVLCVGEAGVFDFTVPVAYNSVFDRSLFQEWCGGPDPDSPNGEWKLRDTADIRDRLNKEGITHLFVNWDEILRYRLTYGYADFVTPARFEELQSRGVLGKPVVLSVQPMPKHDPRAEAELQKWGTPLQEGFVPSMSREIVAWRSQLLYPVLEEQGGDAK